MYEELLTSNNHDNQFIVTGSCGMKAAKGGNSCSDDDRLFLSCLTPPVTQQAPAILNRQRCGRCSHVAATSVRTVKPADSCSLLREPRKWQGEQLRELTANSIWRREQLRELTAQQYLTSRAAGRFILARGQRALADVMKATTGTKSCACRKQH